ncbi:MAG: hypothetical protein ABFD07_08575, partial [Methanobacterium sp.]
DIGLSMVVETNNFANQNTAMERIIYFINNMIQDIIFVDATDIETLKKYKLADLTVCEIPGQPHDQIVGMVILSKLNSIMEGNLYITDMILGSSLSDGVRYQIDAETTNEILYGNYWFNKATLSVNDHNNQKVVSLFANSEWDELGLSWEKEG